MKRYAAALTLTLAVAVAAPARAESVDAQVTRLAKESHAKYKAGDFSGAADLLFQAYELKPDPTLLFNVAKTYEKAGNLDQAIRFYQRYLDQENADPKMMRQASRALEKLQAQDKEQKQKEADQKAKEDADRKAQADALAEQQKQLVETQKQQQQAARDLEVARKQPPPAAPVDRPSKVPGVVVTSIGAAAAIGGGVVGYLALNDSNSEKALHGDFTAKNNLVSKAQNEAHIADICYGVGAIVGTVGIVLLVRALRAPSSDAVHTSDAAPAPADGSSPTPAPAPAAEPAPASTPPASSPSPAPAEKPSSMLFPSVSQLAEASR